jgi:hypothetical protein
MEARFQDGSRRSSRCKPGDRNFGGVAIAARMRASGVWEGEKRVVGESPPIADAFAAREPTREQEGKEGGKVARALLLTCVVVVRSVPGSRRLPVPGPVAVVVGFESCMLTMRTERGVGFGPPEKGTGITIFAGAGCSSCCIFSWVLGGSVGAEHNCCAERVDG